MTDPRSVETVYMNVIEDTITKLAPEFENAGVPLQVLGRLQELWRASVANALRPPVPEPLVPAAIPAVSIARASSSNPAPGTHANPASKATNGAGAHAATANQNGTAPSAPPADPSALDENSLRYTIVEPTDPAASPSIKPETESQAPPTTGAVPVSASASTSTPTTAEAAANGSTTTTTQPTATGDSDSESSSVSDEDEVDTSTWTNSLMSLYEEPIKRTKNKRTYRLAKGILNVGGRDYLFKSGKAEFDWK